MYTAIQEMRDEHGERLILHSPNIVNLCIDSYDEEKQCGRLYHQYTEHTVLFSSLFEALDTMERLYDEIRFPQAAAGFRSFGEAGGGGVWNNGSGGISERLVPQGGATEPEEMTVLRKTRPKETAISENRRLSGRKPAGAVETFDQVIRHRGEDATFIIRVQYRQYSSWQGEVTWMDGRRRLPFRSVLELARLIDNAMYASEKRVTESGKRFPAVEPGNQEGKWTEAEAVSTVNDDGK